MFLAIFGILVLPLAVVLIDSFAGLRASKYQSATFKGRKRCCDFAILVPIYGNIRYLENVDYLRRYGSKVILCTTSGESTEFNEAIDELSRRYGFRVFRSSYVAEPSTKRRTGGTIRDRVVRDALREAVKQTYVVCIDADTTTRQPLEKLVGELHRQGADLASVRLVPQSEGSPLVRLQQFEYRLAMRMRFLMPWLVSGACHVGSTVALRDIMSRHSLFFQGNDVETGLLGEQLGYRVVHIPFEVITQVPSGFKSWWRQRLAWAGGEVRLFIVNFRFILKHPFFWAYGAGLVLALLVLRWYAVVHPGVALLVVAMLYYVVIIGLHWRHRNLWILVMPIYTLFYSLVMVPLGIISYLMMSIPERNYGVIRA